MQGVKYIGVFYFIKEQYSADFQWVDGWKKQHAVQSVIIEKTEKSQTSFTNLGHNWWSKRYMLTLQNLDVHLTFIILMSCSFFYLSCLTSLLCNFALLILLTCKKNFFLSGEQIKRTMYSKQKYAIVIQSIIRNDNLITS